MSRFNLTHLIAGNGFVSLNAHNEVVGVLRILDDSYSVGNIEDLKTQDTTFKGGDENKKT